MNTTDNVRMPSDLVEKIRVLAMCKHKKIPRLCGELFRSVVESRYAKLDQRERDAAIEAIEEEAAARRQKQPAA